MGFVKLDSGILDSTLWMARAQREIFITALLMAEPREIETPMEQMEVNSLKNTGFVVPPGWYGFVAAAGVGIVTRALVAQKEGLDALEALGAPESWSRSQEFEGRRLVRVDGGFIVLNFMKYRDRDYTTAERSRRYRERKKLKESQRDDVTPHRDITQAEAYLNKTPLTPLSGGPTQKPNGHEKLTPREFKKVSDELRRFAQTMIGRDYDDRDALMRACAKVGIDFERAKYMLEEPSQ